MRIQVSKLNQSVAIKWVSSLGFAVFMLSSAQAFEFQEYEKKIKTSYSLQNVVEKFPKRDFEDVLRNFVASGRPNRLAGSPGHKRAQEYLENKLKSFNNIGSSFSKGEFVGESADKKVLTGINYIWEKKGMQKPDEVIYFIAHYDTLIKDPKTKKIILSGEMPGADNNATGVALELSMIEVLNKLDLPKTVKFVFLDLEEVNSQGSKALFKSADFQNDKATKKIIGIANLFMLGHDSKVGDVEKKFNNMKIYISSKSMPGHATDIVFATSFMESGKRNYSNVTFTLDENNSEISPFGFPDTMAPFWEGSIPIMTLTQNREGDLNPRYMTSNDFVETLNFNTYSNVFRYILSSLLAWNYGIVK